MGHVWFLTLRNSIQSNVYQFESLTGRIYGRAMKTFKHAIGILISSPLLWIGTAGVLVSFSTYALLWSGHLMFLAKLADALHLGLYLGSLFAFIFMASICLFIVGLLMGIIRLCRKLNEPAAARAMESPQTNCVIADDPKPASAFDLGRQRHNWMRLLLLSGLLGFLVLLAAAMQQPGFMNYQASPRYTLRIIDNAGQPQPGVRVAHLWGLDVYNHGENEADTDGNGMVVFDPINVAIPVGAWVKMLHVLHVNVRPPVRGLGWENYTTSRLSIFLPEGYELDPGYTAWSKMPPAYGNSYTTAAGFFIKTPPTDLLIPVPDFVKPRTKMQYNFQMPHIDVFFPDSRNEFELPVRKAGQLSASKPDSK